MTPAVGQTVWYVGPETDGVGVGREARVLAVRSKSPGARLDLVLASGFELLNVAPLHPLNGAGWRWPDPPAAPAPWEREVACACGEACEVVDYPTGYRPGTAVDRAVRVGLVGEAPPACEQPGGPLSRACGHRLAALAGLDQDEYLALFPRRNLLWAHPGMAGKGTRWPAARARAEAARWAELRADGDCTHAVLLGRAAEAFGLAGAAWFEWRPCPPWRGACAVPHPSGIVRWWNDPGNLARAGLFLRAMAAANRGLAEAGDGLNAAFELALMQSAAGADVLDCWPLRPAEAGPSPLRGAALLVQQHRALDRLGAEADLRRWPAPPGAQ